MINQLAGIGAIALREGQAPMMNKAEAVDNGFSRELAILGDVVQMLEKTALDLRQRLDGVLRPSQPSPTTPAGHGPQMSVSPAANAVANIRQRVREATDVLHDIHSRLDI